MRTGEIGADRRETHQRRQTQGQDAAAHFDGQLTHHRYDEAAKDRLVKGLDSFLELARDRTLFDLPPLPTTAADSP